MNKFITYNPKPNPCNPDNPFAIICDMDNTIAHGHERHVYDYEKVDTDIPDLPIIDLVRGLAKPAVYLIILTAREDIGNCRLKTTEWVKKHVGLEPNLVLMRSLKDHRHSNEVKKDLIIKHVIPYFNVLYIFEDSKRSADMYRELGFKVIMPAFLP